MRTQHHEVVVLGGTTSAAAIAAMLGKRGVRGLLVDEGEAAAGPADTAFVEPRSAALDLVASEVGLAHDLERERRARRASTVQLVFADERVDLGTTRAELFIESRRRMPVPRLSASLDALDTLEEQASAFLLEAGDLSPSGFFARRKYSSVARRHARVLGDGRTVLGEAGALGEGLAGVLPFLVYQDLPRGQPIPMLALARLAARFLRGITAPERSPRERLLDVADSSGFERVHGAIDRLDPRGKPLRFALARTGEVLTADLLIDASADLAGLRTISQKGRPGALGVMLEAATPRGHLHTLDLEVDRAVLPPPLGERVVLLNGRRDPREGEAEDRPILIASAGAKDARRARFVAYHPLTQVQVHAEGIERLERVMRARIERLIPFLAEGRPTVTGAPLRGHPLYDAELDPIAGVARVGPRTPYKNVLVGGPAVLPGLGGEGEHLVALQVARAALELLGRTKDGRPVAVAARRG